MTPFYYLLDLLFSTFTRKNIALRYIQYIAIDRNVPDQELGHTPEECVAAPTLQQYKGLRLAGTQEDAGSIMPMSFERLSLSMVSFSDPDKKESGMHDHPRCTICQQECSSRFQIVIAVD